MSSNRRRVDHFLHHETVDRHNRSQTNKLDALEKAHTQDGVGGGSKLGVMTDSIASSNNTISSQSVLTASRLNNIQNAITQDGVGGGNKLGVMTDAINTNVIASLAKLDTIATNTANIHIDVESVNLNVDTLEAKTEAISNGQTQNGDGTGNKPGVMLDAINSNTITGNSKLDTIITNTASSSSTGLATETTLAAAEVHLGNIENGQTQNGDGTGNKPGVMLDAINTNIISLNSKMVVGQTTSGMATAANQQVVDLTLQGIDGILGNIETDAAALEVLQTATNTKLDTLETTANAIQTAVEIIDNCISGSEAQVDVVTLPALPTGSNTIGTVNLSATDNAVLDAIATDGDNIQTKLDTLITSNAAIKTAVEIIDNVVSGSEAQVDVVTLPALATGSNTIGTVNLSATDNAVLDAIATDGDNIQTKLDTLITSNAAIKTAVEIIDNVVSGSEAQVDVVTLPALATGSNTIGTVNLSATDNAVLDAIATDGDNIQTKLDTLETTLTAIETDQAAIEVLLTAANVDHAANEVLLTTIADVVKAEDAAHSGGDKGIMGLSVRKDTATNLAGSDSDYQPLITGSAGHLHVNDSLHHRVKDVAFLTTENISANSVSSTFLDTEGFSCLFLYGECTNGTTFSGTTELKIQGSNASGGTYFACGSLSSNNYESGRSQAVNVSVSNNQGDLVGNQTPRFLKIYNNTSGTIQLTLRAVLSHFNTYI